MLTPEQIEGFRLAAGRLIDPINTYLLKDIARRIQDAESSPAPPPMKPGVLNGWGRTARNWSETSPSCSA